MKVNEQIISIPPFISTSWNNVAAIHMRGAILLVTLIDGDTIAIPDLPTEVIETVFHFHALHIEQYAEEESQSRREVIEQTFGLPFKIGVGPVEGFGSSIMHHSPQQGDMPNIPREFLEKITTVVKAVAGEEALQCLKAEPHCNCPHCQLARTYHLTEEGSVVTAEGEIDPDSEVRDEELQFQQWTIDPVGENLFNVTNRIDPNESYQVFLGNPVGCTCGHNNCEHLIAVLKSPVE